MNNISIVETSKCCGCSACLNSCSKHCISMVYDEEGFRFPKIIETECVNCGLCIANCPAMNDDYEKREPLLTLASVARDSKEVVKSSSGGAFFEIAKFFISDMKGYVCGCAIDEQYKVSHFITNQIEEMKKMQGSKYVQSDIITCGSRIREYVLKDIPVLFAGTPCQVEAIKRIVGKGAELLYTIDIVCHGVTSPGWFKKYMTRNYADSNLISFRYKNPYEISTYAFSFDDGKRVYSELDPFYNAFLEGSNLRESCYSCKYACSRRIGDVTLGDCANFRAFPEFRGKSISTVLVNTEKGKELWNLAKKIMESREANYDSEVALNHQLGFPVKRPAKRNDFYKDINSLRQIDFKEKYASKWSIKKKIKRFIIMRIPYSIRSRIH